MMHGNDHLLGVFVLSIWPLILAQDNVWPYQLIDPGLVESQQVNQPHQPTIRPQLYDDTDYGQREARQYVGPRPNFQVYTGNRNRQYAEARQYGQYGQPDRRGYSAAGHEGPYRKPFDLTIPSYAYIPERYTGVIEHLVNPPIFAAGTPGVYIRDWNNYTANFRENDVPSTPAYDSLWQNMIAYIDGHPVTPYTYATTTTTATTPVSASLLQFLKLSGENSPNSPRFRPCASRRSGNRFGVCVDDSVVTQLCVGKSVGKSVICGRSQSCCLDLSSSDDTSDVELNPQMPVVGPSFKPCGTLVRGVLNFGVCVNDGQLDDLCSAKFVTQSPSCTLGQSCCNDQQSDRPRTQLLPPTIPERQLSTTTLAPATSTAITTVANVQSPDVSAIARRPRPCIPNWNTPQLGICVDDHQLGQMCIDQIISKSENCAAEQSCCMDTTSSDHHPPQQLDPAVANPPTPEPFTTQAPVIPRPLNTILFRNRNSARRRRPITRAQASISCSTPQSSAVGACVSDFAVADQCTGQAVFRSPDCPSSQTCCVAITSQTPPIIPQPPITSNELISDKSIVPQQTSFVPCVSDGNDLLEGICVEKNLVASLCTQRIVSQSQNCPVRQSCCTDMQLNDRTAQISDDAPSLIDLPSASTFRTCATPSTGFQRGLCVQDNFVSRLCGGQFIAKSSDCTDVQTCCVGDAVMKVAMEARANLLETTLTPTTTIAAWQEPSTFVWPQVFQQCIPIINNFQLGVCVNEHQVENLCSGRLIAPSRSCALQQSCCSYFPDSAEGRQVVTQLPPTTTTTEVETWPPTTTTTVETTTDQPQNVFHPCAATGNVVGVCVNQWSAMDYCMGKLIAVSEDCSRSQLCCYDTTK